MVPTRLFCRQDKPIPSKDTDGGGHQTDSGTDNDDLDITSTIIMQGNGATIHRDQSLSCTLNKTAQTGEFRIFEVKSGGNLTLDSVTVMHGCADGSGNPALDGGGIYVASGGKIRIANSTIALNSADFGGGIRTEIAALCSSPTAQSQETTPALVGAVSLWTLALQWSSQAAQSLKIAPNAAAALQTAVP